MKNFLQIQFLLNLPQIGSATIKKKYKHLIERNSSLEETKEYVLSTNPNLKEAFPAAEESAKRIEYSIVNTDDVSIITFTDEDFPKNLKTLKSDTLFLYVKGNQDILNDDNIAFIGTRNPSSHARKVEKEIVKRVIEESKRVIVSGLALGCDQISHEVAVENNHPTIAVLPSGFNNIAPSNNTELANKIIETGGCLVSEYSPSTQAQKYYFPARDKIVAELSDGLIVVQCEENSGTMYTVKTANKYGTPIACNTAYGEDLPYGGNELTIKEMGANNLKDRNSLIDFISKLDNTNNTENVQLSLDF